MSGCGGKLYVVGTPIGNLEDMTYRAVRILSEADFICAEDTRVTRRLLTHFGISKPLYSCHKFTERQAVQGFAQKIADGAVCAVVSDAGMPCISDPGEELVKICRDMGISVESVPGPTAVTTAAAICGMSAARFAFEGFLSVHKKHRRERLEELKNDRHTLIFYEAPHKLRATLSDLYDAFGDRQTAICRELTKIHEEVLRMSLSEAIQYYQEKDPKGEYVLVVEGAAVTEESTYTLEDGTAEAQRLINEGMKATEACKQAAKLTGFRKSEIYDALSSLD